MGQGFDKMKQNYKVYFTLGFQIFIVLQRKETGNHSDLHCQWKHHLLANNPN